MAAAAMITVSKMVLGAGAFTAVTGCFSAGAVYAAGKERCEPAGREVRGAQGGAGLSIAPQFDGLNCFETFVSTGSRPTGSAAARAPRPTDGRFGLAPQFDGLNCFETLVSTPHS